MKKYVEPSICGSFLYSFLTPLTSQLTATEKMFDGFFLLAILIIFVTMILISKRLKKGFLKGISVFWTVCIAVLFLVRLISYLNSL